MTFDREKRVLSWFRWGVLFPFNGFESLENSSRFEMEDGSTSICHAVEDQILCQ